MIITIYLALGAVAGLLAGLLGVGGGLVIVPVLFLVFTHLGFDQSLLMHMAIATSLSTIVLTSLTSSYAHHRHGAVQWRDVWLLAPGMLLGAALGALVADELSNTVLKHFFAVFEILVALQVLLSLSPEGSNKTPGYGLVSIAGLITGGLSAILGSGGGTLTVPFLLWCGRSIRHAVATSAVCGFPIALSGSLFYILSGIDEQQALPAHSVGYLYWPAFLSISVSSLLFAPLGAKLAHSLPVATLKKTFAALLFIIGVRLLLL